MTFLGLAARNLVRHRVRNALTVLGIAVSVIALYAILSFNTGFMRNLSAELGRTGVHFMIMPAGCPHEVAALVLHGAVTPTFLDARLIEKLEGLLGPETATLARMLLFQEPNRARNRVDLVHGTDFSSARAMKPGWKVEGRLPEAPGEVLLGYEVAQADKARPGDAYAFAEGAPFTVVGTLGKTSSRDDAFVFMPLAAAQELLGKPGAVTGIGVRLVDPARQAGVIERLGREVPGIQVVTMNQVMNSITMIAASARVLGLSVAAVAILVSLVGVMNTVLMTVFEQTQEIGMMRAVGASARQVFLVVLQESALMTAAGAAGGIVVAVLSARGIEGFVRGFMPYVPQGSLILFDPLLAAGCVLFIILAGSLAGLYPAWRASRISPIEAIRS